MKVLYRISLFFSIGCIAFFLGILSNQMYRSYIEKQVKAREERFEPYSQKDTLDVMETEDVVETTTKKEAVVDCDTKYLVESYDNVTKERTKEEAMLPAKYIGMNREELEEELRLYSMAPTLRDQEKGFLSASLSAFSPRQIVVQKNYSLPEINEFYLTVEDNVVVVYESSSEAIYMITDILLEDLPQDLQEEIINRKYIENEEAVYHFLESYSS